MEDAVKAELLEQFRRYLDGIDDVPLPTPETGSEADLFTLAIEMAALRTESRLIKDALDQFRAVFQTLQFEPWQDGLRMTLRRLDQMLLERRVASLELLGQRFDPRLGRVVATRDAAGVEAGIVLEVVRAGFLWDEALLRPAEVIVSKLDMEEQA